VGGPLLDALDVSEPSFRMAAGILAAVAGIATVFRRPPSREPALPGRRAALVPVAIPIVAGPVLLILALGAGADGGLLVTAGAMVLGVAVLTALTRTRTESGWAGRLLSAALIACGVLLAIDGLLDV
jgi:small neutral amino acid transporter SnatA (MarC family)